MIFETYLNVKRPWATTLDADDLNLTNNGVTMLLDWWYDDDDIDVDDDGEDNGGGGVGGHIH